MLLKPTFFKWMYICPIQQCVLECLFSEIHTTNVPAKCKGTYPGVEANLELYTHLRSIFIG